MGIFDRLRGGTIRIHLLIKGRIGDDWKVIDIVTEGSSLVNNYKNQFHRIIQKDGYEALIKRMKDKLAKNQSA